jgi:hypothetical protein
MKKEVWETVIADIEKDIASEKGESEKVDTLELCRIEGMLVAVSALLFYDNDISDCDKIGITIRIQQNLDSLT